MKRYIIAILLSLCSIMAMGQVKISGTVTGMNKQPLPGVSVIVANTLTGVSTDAKGYYEISVSDQNAELVFSYISYVKVTEKVGSRRTINVVLVEDMQQIDDIVVVGYGAVKKSDLTSSIASLKGKEMQKMTVSNPTESMQGRLAGVQVVGTSAPASHPKVLIRGFSSINLSTDPLYVVDGVPVSGGTINYLNPSDIENIEVLKDASASAIYGSRASNGVVMVTTKKGRVGKANFTIDVTFGGQQMNSPYDMADAVEYAEIINLAATNSGYGVDYDDPQSYRGKTTDWWKAGIRKYTPQMNFNFGVNGGTEKHLYAISLNYYDQDSFYEKGGYKRFTARISNDFKFAKWVSAGVTLNPRYQSWGNPTNWADFIRIDPISTIYKPADQLTGEENEYSIFAWSPSYVWNPVASVKRWNESNKGYALTTDAYLEIKPWKNLVIRSQVGYEVDSRISDNFVPDFVIDAATEHQTNNMVSRSQPMYINWSLQNTITYMNTFAKKHNVNLMVGNTLEEWNGTTLWGQKEKIPNNSNDLQEISAGTLNPQTTGSSYTTSILSYLGRIMYNYDQRYYLTATYRMDGSSKFMSKNKWASFPSVSLAWRISNEKFMEPVAKTLNDLKLRFGWGRVGNQNLPASVYLSKLGQGYYVYNGDIVNTTYPIAVKNEDIKWETVEDINAGLDFGLFGNKLTGTFEFYHYCPVKVDK